MDDDLRGMEHQIAQRRPKIRPPQKMADVLSNLLARKGYARVLTTGGLEDAWQAACGSRFAGDTRAGNVKRGILEVFVRNSAVLQELTFQKKQLIRALQQQAPDQQITDLRFKVGAVG